MDLTFAVSLFFKCVQLERELLMKGTLPEDVTILLAQVKARLR
jgi:hypothetical protein